VGTLQSAQFAGLLGKFSGGARVVAQAAPGLVECVESGDIDSVATRSKVASFVRPLLEKGADVIVLGCTHYPFLRSVIQEIAGPQVVLIDTGLAVARQLERRLEEAEISDLEKQGSGRERFFTSADPAGVEKAAAMLWHPSAVVEFAEV
jgi:glutamate racemase